MVYEVCVRVQDLLGQFLDFTHLSHFSCQFLLILCCLSLRVLILRFQRLVCLHQLCVWLYIRE